jgi:aerobic-type carbon monoxide dehydrogenase small subunit (CoxS/CutS family)
MSVTVTVNGSVEQLEIDTRQNLVGLLREQLGLTGTHVGCSSEPFTVTVMDMRTAQLPLLAAVACSTARRA